jgi:fatty acid desaturase
MTVVDGTAVPRRAVAGIEWQTLWLMGAAWAGFAALTWYWEALGWWIAAPLGAYLVALHGSLQHEALHGHPTRSAVLNELLVFPAVTLWFPFRRYKAMHLKHHDNDHLTEPGIDPESFYLDPQAWDGAPRWLKTLYSINNSMLGRFILGPAISTARLVTVEAGLILAGDRRVAKAWALHGLGVALVWLWVSAICGMPFWQYVLFIAYWGNALSMMRSYAEHRAHEEVGCRTIVVETNPIVSLLFLNNNLHMAHHEQPTLPWYEIPAYYQRHRDRLLKENCAYLVKGYREIARHWLLTPKEPVRHPHL